VHLAGFIIGNLYEFCYWGVGVGVSNESCRVNIILFHACALSLFAYAKVVTYENVTLYMFPV
jgi:hypothetical protein